MTWPSHELIILRIAASTLTWTILYILSRPISLALFGRQREGYTGYPADDSEKAADWDSRVVSFVHCIIIIPLAAFTLMDESIRRDHATGYSDTWLLCNTVAAGFFIWDTFVCLKHFKTFGISFVIHAVLCMAAYVLCSLAPIAAGGYSMPFWCSAALLFESSTPWLNVRYFLLKLKKTDSKLFTLVQIGFGLTFFASRLLWGGYICVGLMWFLYFDDSELSQNIPAHSRLVFSVILPLTALNCFWFFSNINNIIKRSKNKYQKLHQN